MAKQAETEKRSRGRPPGREYSHIAQVPMRPEMRDQLMELAEREGRPAAAVMRDAIERYLSRRRAGAAKRA